jgi:Ca-activated chloride channel family protein
MAAAAVSSEFAVSTVGVGDEFNEFLMATIADRGTGNYYYLDDPGAFAEVFQKEFYLTRAAAVTGLTVSVPLPPGVELIDASGYPLTRKNGRVEFHPGSLAGGQQRHLFLAFRVPTGQEGRFEIGSLTVSFRHAGERLQATLPQTFMIACVADEVQVHSSIDRERWQTKVLQEDFNRLKEEVAADIKAGNERHALDRIDRYYRTHSEVNAMVDSEQVRRNLSKDVQAVRTAVGEAFSGPPGAVEQKQKSTAKAMQYEGYSGRRMQ